jgi:hypothetical protein
MVLALAMTGAACGRPATSPPPAQPPAGYSMSGDGGVVRGDGSAAPARCSLEMECPPPTSECTRAVCLPDGNCGQMPATAGTSAITQHPGDCQANVCDGAGGVMAVPDDSDVPDDGNGCTQDSCLDGAPTFTNRPAGASCSEGGGATCDGSGQCGGAQPSQRIL